jgi:hypothetical protein
MSHHYEPQTEFAYPRPRRQRRMLVALLVLGGVWPILWGNLANRLPRMHGGVSLAIFLAGTLPGLLAFIELTMTMKNINQKPMRDLDERQALVSGRSYRNAWHIVAIGTTLAYLLHLLGWLSWLEVSPGSVFSLMMVQSLPLAIMAWTEPD